MSLTENSKTHTHTHSKESHLKRRTVVLKAAQLYVLQYSFQIQRKCAEQKCSFTWDWATY